MTISEESEPRAVIPPGLRLLVAEDHDFQRRMIVEMLRNLGAAEIHEAACGTEALETLDRVDQAVDIIISDLDMPGMDGMELLRHLGESGCPASLIIASSMDRSLVRTVLSMAGAYNINLLGAIDKPPAPESLARLIASHDPDRNVRARSRPRGLAFSLDEVRTGLEQEQFEPFFQPKIALATGAVTGLEALARWRHPEHGVVSPYAFIETIEENGLVGKLTRTMVDKATGWCRSWRDGGHDVSIAINVSIHSLANLGLAERLTQDVVRQGLEPRHVTVEITETVAMTDVGKVLENLSRLRMKGFALAIDDYGTGYSSMQQLDRSAASELKIDRAFVTGAHRRESSRVILQSSLEMAARLGLVTVAEGVETQDEWDLLSEFGCDQAQGYMIARPMPAEEVGDWIADWHSKGRYGLVGK
ncbi:MULTISPECIES: EAL domain-containing protein [unclassified Wenzhouxiangella]|uniref:EAL domain-containing response regulator n=1 Tax=unclassified Wenzhouxiangella TaxID=2613841 RepID=UPI000E32B9A9|nr:MULTISPECIES: EAL domain-containing response regulator [unclassified Wenzhouxiangella]RFF28379.1 EAL domain-containing protein [Wenzhouxiangella sp. 15181]RFP69895.1 EAL domain-containing protein [Wenzhouxiangella sp. 15190]